MVLNVTHVASHPYAARFPTYSVATPDEAPLNIKSSVATKEFGCLIDLLSEQFDLTTIQFAGLLVEDLNEVNWDPADAQEVLEGHAAGLVENPGAWFTRHAAARQAKNLQETTPGTKDMKLSRSFKVLRLDSQSLPPTKRRL